MPKRYGTKLRTPVKGGDENLQTESEISGRSLDENRDTRYLTLKPDCPGSRFKKKLAVTRGRKIYSDYVHGVALRVLGEVFARLPTVQVGLVTGVVPQIDPASGQEVDVALFSVMATRDEFSRINFAALKSIDPAESLTLFYLRRDMTKTAIFRPVNPITIEELDSGTGK